MRSRPASRARVDTEDTQSSGANKLLKRYAALMMTEGLTTVEEVTGVVSMQE